MLRVVAVASRLTCQAGGSVLSHLRSAALKAITCHSVFGAKEESCWYIQSDLCFSGC